VARHKGGENSGYLIPLNCLEKSDTTQLSKHRDYLRLPPGIELQDFLVPNALKDTYRLIFEGLLEPRHDPRITWRKECEITTTSEQVGSVQIRLTTATTRRVERQEAFLPPKKGYVIPGLTDVGGKNWHRSQSGNSTRCSGARPCMYCVINHCEELCSTRWPKKV
jgi:hypothetical protein